jgi:putative transcriptional regulator
MSAVKIRLLVLRTERRMSQRRLAALAGVRPDTVSALERGAATSIHFETLARFCEALECEPGELFALERDPHRVPVLGGPEEDEVVQQRLQEPGRRVDGPSFIAELVREAGERSQQVGRRK